MSAYGDLLDAKLAIIREAERDFTGKVAELQAHCPHAEVSGWLYGYRCFVKMCLRCHKVMEQVSHDVGAR